jgi:DNA polymerase
MPVTLIGAPKVTRSITQDWELKNKRLSLDDTNALIWISDADTEITLNGIKFDDEPAFTLERGQLPPPRYYDYLQDPTVYQIRHNDPFDYLVDLKAHAEWGWPIFPAERRLCTLQMCRALNLPGTLGGAAQHLGLTHQKDKAGANIMRKHAKGKKPLTPEEQLIFERYTVADPEATYELYQRIYHLYQVPAFEVQHLIPMFQRINDYGVPTNRILAQGFAKIVEAEAENNNAAFVEATHGRFFSIGQIKEMKAVFAEHGIKTDSLNEEYLTGLDVNAAPQIVQDIKHYRLRGNKISATSKPRSFASHCSEDGCIHDAYVLNGASATGRSTSYGANLLNPPHFEIAPDDIGEVLALGQAGDHGAFAQRFPDVLGTISSATRLMHAAKPGFVLVSADYSGVESCLTAWGTRQLSKMQMWEDYFRTGDPRLEPYCLLGARFMRLPVGVVTKATHPKERFVGKTGDLAAGFGGSVGAYRRIDPNTPFTDRQIKKRIIDKWQAMHPQTEAFWYALRKASVEAVDNPGRIVPCGMFTYHMEDEFLIATLPSGRRLCYANAHLGTGKFDEDPEVLCKRMTVQGWRNVRLWHGLLIENLVQACGRDILFYGMWSLQQAGFNICMQLHDECVTHVPLEEVDLDKFVRHLTTKSEWASDLPLAAKACVSRRFDKSDWTRAQKLFPGDQIAQIKYVVDLAKQDACGQVIPVLQAFQASTKKQPEPQIAVQKPKPQPPEPEPAPAPKPTPPRPLPSPAAPIEVEEEPMVAEGDNVFARLKAEIYLPDFIGGRRVHCPFHDPQGARSASVEVKATRFKCHAHDCYEYGDIYDWLTETEGLTLQEAYEVVAEWSGDAKHSSRQQQIEQDERGRKYAKRLWLERRPLIGSLAGKYLRDERYVDLAQLPADIDQTLGFHPYCPFGTDERGNTRYVPALLGLFRDVLTNQPCSIHRVGLTRDGKKIERQMLGKWPGQRAVKLWALSGPILAICEGIETGLAAGTVKRIIPVWALGSAGAIERFPVIPGVRRLYILVDNDPVGQAKARLCAQRWKAAGIKVVLLPATELGFDANDVVRRQRVQHVSA